MDHTEQRFQQIEGRVLYLDKKITELQEKVKEKFDVQIKEYKTLEHKLERLKRAVIIEVHDDIKKDLVEKQKELDTIADLWPSELRYTHFMPSERRQIHFIIVKIEEKYFLFLTHILRLLELNLKLELPHKFKIIDNHDSRKSMWATSERIQKKFNIRIEQILDTTKQIFYSSKQTLDTSKQNLDNKIKLLLDTSKQISDTYIKQISELSKIQYFKKPTETSDIRKKVFLVELDSKDKDEKDVIGCPMFRFNEKNIITFDNFLKEIEDEVYVRKFQQYSPEKMDEIDGKIPIPKNIIWDINDDYNYLHESKELFLEGEVYNFYGKLKKRIEHFEKINQAIEDSRLLKYPFQEANAYNKWFELSSTMRYQIDYFLNKVKLLAEKELTADKQMLEKLVGERSCHEITLIGVVKTLKSFLGFYIGVYYTNFPHEKMLEPDLFSILLTSNLRYPVGNFGNNSSGKEDGRGNLNQTVAKKFSGILMFLEVLVTNVVKDRFRNKELETVVKNNIKDVLIKRAKYYKTNSIHDKKNGALGGTAVDNEISPSALELEDCFLRFREKLLKSNKATSRDIQKLLFLGLANEKNGFRKSSYEGMIWGGNVNTFNKYTQYQLKEGDEPKVEKNPYLFIKKVLTDWLEKSPNEKYFVGIDALAGHLKHKKAHLDSAFISFYTETSILFHDTAALILRIKQDTEASNYLKLRQTNLNDFSSAYKWMEDRKINFVDRMGEKHFGEPIFSANVLDLLREIFMDYNKEVKEKSDEESLNVASNYTIRGLRRMSIEFLSDKKLSPNVRSMLCKTVLLHTEKTHYNIYDRTNHFLGSKALRRAREAGFLNDTLNTLANHESLQPYKRPETNNIDIDVDACVDNSHEVLMKLKSHIINLIKEVESIWDNEGKDVLFLMKFKIDNIEENIMKEILEYEQIDYRAPNNREIDLIEDDWELYDFLLIILCNMKEENPDRYNIYQELLQEYISKEDIEDHIDNHPEWKRRRKLMEKYFKSKKSENSMDVDDDVDDTVATATKKFNYKSSKRPREEEVNLVEIGQKVNRHGLSGCVTHIEVVDEEKMYTVEYPVIGSSKCDREDITHDDLQILLENNKIEIVSGDSGDSGKPKRRPKKIT